MKSTDHTDNAAKQDNIPLTFGTIDSWGKLSALLVGVVYICGFLTLNSHLSKYGIVGLGIASSEYLVAGSIFILYLVAYSLFGGRAIVLGKKWMGQDLDQLIENNVPPTIASLIAYLYSLVHLVFLHCLSAAVFSTLAFEQYESTGFYIVLIFIFLISYTLDIIGFDIKHRFTHTIIDLILKSFAVYSFFNLSSGVNLLAVLLAFIMYSFYINLILDGFERYKITKDRVVFTFIYSAIFFIGSAVNFGATTYGNVSKKLGGGKSIKMEIELKKDALGSLTDDVKSLFVGDVLYSSSENTYIKVEDKVIILPRSSAQWMRFDLAKEKGLLDGLFGLTKK